MQRRIITLLLLLLTAGLFVLHRLYKNKDEPNFVEFVTPIVAADPRIVQDEFLILMESGYESYLDDVLAQFDLHMVSPLAEWIHVARNQAHDHPNVISLYSKRAQDNQMLAAEIEAHHAVHSAQLNYIQNSDPMQSCAKCSGHDSESHASEVIPHDPYFHYQWHLSKEKGINLPGAWSITTGNPKVVIALVDRNFDFFDHDLSQERCPSRDYYFENLMQSGLLNRMRTAPETIHHGTYVLSVIAPCTDNSLGLAGIDWRAQVFAVDTLSDTSLSARLLGILWAAGVDVCKSSVATCSRDIQLQKNRHPANIINASFGFGESFLLDPPYGPVLDVIGQVNRLNAIIFASTGNEGDLADRRLPGSASGVISIGASTEKKQSAPFSNYGRSVDVLAPGVNIIAQKNGEFISLNGTSFSSPIAAGVGSLMLAKNEGLSWKHIEYILKNTATRISCDDYCPKSLGKNSESHCRNYCCKDNNVICAKGIIDAKRAVTMAAVGLPNTALIDMDDYYLPLSQKNHLKISNIVKNWGKKSAIVRMKQTDPHLKIAPEIIRIPPVNDRGMPGTAKVLVYYDEMPAHGVVSSLILEGANSDEPNVFHDRIEAIVEIVPDLSPGRKQRILRELLPKE